MTLARYVLGFLFTGAGILHFVKRDLFDRLVPNYLSKYRREVDIGSGLLQVIGGLSFFIPKLRGVARWSSLGLLIPAFPEAFNQVRHPERMKELGLSPTLVALRIPVQAVVVVLVWWATKAPKRV